MAENNIPEIRGKLVNVLYEDLFQFFNMTLFNPTIKPALTFEEIQVIVRRIEQSLLEQQMFLYFKYLNQTYNSPLSDKKPKGDFYK